jgi:hypothetical protein
LQQPWPDQLEVLAGRPFEEPQQRLR